MTIDKRRYGFNIFSRPVEEVLEYSAENKMQHVEIHLADDHSPIESFTAKRIENIVNFTTQNKISLGLHLPNKINTSDMIPVFRKKNIKYLIDCISLAGRLHADSITVHIGSFYWFPVERWMRKKALNRFIDSIEQVLNYCAETQVCLALENVVPIPQGSEYHYLGDNLNDFEYIFQQLNSEYVKMCLDTGHANVGEGVTEYINLFSENIISIHYHDNIGNDDQHLPVGEGNINWPEFATEILKSNFTGPLISECRKLRPHESAQLLEKYFEVAEKNIRALHL